MWCPALSWWRRWKEKRKLQHRQDALQNFKVIINNLDRKIEKTNELLLTNMNAVVLHQKRGQGSEMVYAMKVVNLVREIESLQSESLYAETQCQTIERKNRMDAMQLADRFAGEAVAGSSKSDDEYKKERENLSLVNTKYRAMIDDMKIQLNDKDDRHIAGKLLTTLKKTKITSDGDGSNVNSLLAGVSLEVARGAPSLALPVQLPALTAPSPSQSPSQSQSRQLSLSSQSQSPLSLQYNPSPYSFDPSELHGDVGFLQQQQQQQHYEQKQKRLAFTADTNTNKALVPFSDVNVNKTTQQSDRQLVKLVTTNKHIPQRPSRQLQSHAVQSNAVKTTRKSGYQKLLTAPGIDVEVEIEAELD